MNQHLREKCGRWLKKFNVQAGEWASTARLPNLQGWDLAKGIDTGTTAPPLRCCHAGEGPIGRDSEAKPENQITSQVLWMNQFKEREPSLISRREENLNGDTQMELEVKQMRAKKNMPSSKLGVVSYLSLCSYI